MAADKIIRNYGKTISKYCRYFLLADFVLICIVVYIWYNTLCNGSFCTTVETKERINILAFGDSLTKGLVKRRGSDEIYYPYSVSLKKTLSRLHSREVRFVVDNAGVNGDKAIGTAEARLQSALKSKQYEWVIILLGTNDLRAFLKYDDYRKRFTNSTEFVEKLFAQIKEMCKMSLNTHAMVIVGTITAWQCEEHSLYCEPLTINREALNKKIRDYVFDTRELLILADFDQALEYKQLSMKERQMYWQDDVHLTEMGYELMAKLIYKKMLPYLPEMVKQPYNMNDKESSTINYHTTNS